MRFTSRYGVKCAANVAYIVPSFVSAIRVLIAYFLVTELIKAVDGILVAALVGVPVVFILDAVDGILARRLKSETLIGSFIDIAGDRLVEFLFLQCFVRAGLIPLWFVVAFYGRIILTDSCRMRAFRAEKVLATGIVLPRKWGLFVLSKLSRSTYAALKGVLFSVLLLAMYRGETAVSQLELGLLLTVLTFSFLRALPILFTYFPRRIDTTRLRQRDSIELNNSTRRGRVASWVQLAYDVCLAMVLIVLFTLQ
jgi:phosphatidylglycerophosphate synthase